MAKNLPPIAKGPPRALPKEEAIRQTAQPEKVAVMTQDIVFEDSNFIIYRGWDQEGKPTVQICARTDGSDTLPPMTPQEATRMLGQMSIAIMSTFRGEPHG